MYKARIIFNIELSNSDDSISRENLIIKTKEIYDAFKFISLSMKIDKSIFVSECKILEYDGDSSELKSKKEKYAKLLSSCEIIEKCVRSIEERTGKIEIGSD